MKKIQYDHYGDNSVLAMVESPKPQPQQHEILIRTKSVSINPLDWKIRNGAMEQVVPMKFPVTPGMDISGIVEAVGPEVKTIKPGDRVISFVESFAGTYSEYAITQDSWTAVLPNKVSFSEGAAIPVTGLTAWEAIVDSLNIIKG
ncbi:alcohol dehydrogenase catalytic domain-containing protein [Lentilactobacillus diolivorans]|uniref:Alcohol dehydrogenase-like N-terminal domain-containing protein n=2 Tax=Lentilactobacillus diolivorans TaxID=179838 RepID=A0A0R1STS2_9LACO|nr:alcohol dehydrogenase catalytic domain-containing protein [Lentilactobacillus diolivorans]KRL68635.1 hypothetical protein FC85_GL002456 [Lentilactobacillus diolivorans DSM 14421]GEP24881.1 hypothetical protein LDI01_24740 [Lentilactobacillus diolivorans]